MKDIPYGDRFDLLLLAQFIVQLQLLDMSKKEAKCNGYVMTSWNRVSGVSFSMYMYMTLHVDLHVSSALHTRISVPTCHIKL